MRIVLDTNVFLVSLSSRSPFYPIYQALITGQIDVFVTNEIVTEYEEQLSHRFNMTRTDLQLRELLNLSHLHRIEVYYNWQLVEADPDDDDKFVNCAFASGADYLVTNDRHFNVLSQYAFPKVDIIRAEDFLALL